MARILSPPIGERALFLFFNVQKERTRASQPLPERERERERDFIHTVHALSENREIVMYSGPKQ